IVARDLHLELTFDAWTVRGQMDGEPIDYRDTVSGYSEQVSAFVRAVQTNDQSLIRSSYRDALRTFATTLAANRSLVSGTLERVVS
ncbi:MAG: gfo/Idh/MocA family oxidoreductase, partial [Chloroflexi bacterium]|nr:gfo/Idh/MocA family oxidoreductase [Chloroflexota bacterium]